MDPTNESIRKHQINDEDWQKIFRLKEIIPANQQLTQFHTKTLNLNFGFHDGNYYMKKKWSSVLLMDRKQL